MGAITQETDNGTAIAEAGQATDSETPADVERSADPERVTDVGGLGDVERAGPERAADPERAAVVGSPGDPERAAELLALGAAFRGVFAALRRLRGRDTHLPGMELSHAQCELLFELDERGELSVGELAAAAQLTPATVTQMLEHLAEHGHVQRSRLQSDRRVVVSRLTAGGRRELERKRLSGRRRWEAALADVDLAEIQAATRVLTRLQAVFHDGAGCSD